MNWPRGWLAPALVLLVGALWFPTLATLYAANIAAPLVAFIGTYPEGCIGILIAMACVWSLLAVTYIRQ